MMTPPDQGTSGVEIERTYLLSAPPILPSHAEAIRIEQGYLPDAADPNAAAADIVEGRIRRKILASGDVRCTHTIKRGHGIRRTEIERPIDVSEFESLWPHTLGRRVRKIRHRVPEKMGSLDVVWEVDIFADMPLALAEVELPSEEIEVRPPDWLATHIVRDVTDEKAYRNYTLATEGPPPA